jgi:hypothetical protein
LGRERLEDAERKKNTTPTKRWRKLLRREANP